MPQDTPKNGLKEFSNLKARLDPIVAKLGRMPTQRELGPEQRDVANAIARHGGYVRVAEKLGAITGTKPAGHWENMDSLRAAVSDIVPSSKVVVADGIVIPSDETTGSLGRMPTANDLLKK